MVTLARFFASQPPLPAGREGFLYAVWAVLRNPREKARGHPEPYLPAPGSAQGSVSIRAAVTSPSRIVTWMPQTAS